MAGNKEIEVEDFATIAQTNNILGSSIGGGGGGSEFVAKIQAISGGAREDLLTSYSSMEFIPLSKVQKQIDNIQTLNTYISPRNGYCRIGIVSNRSDSRIPFSFSTDLNNITFGVVIDGQIITAPISLGTNTTAYWNAIHTVALSGDYLFCSAGSSSNSTTQYRVYKIDNGRLNPIGSYTGSTFKYPRSFGFVRRNGNVHEAYFNASGTYRYMAAIKVNSTNGSVSYTRGADLSPICYLWMLDMTPLSSDEATYSSLVMTEQLGRTIGIHNYWDPLSSSSLKPVQFGTSSMNNTYFARAIRYNGRSCLQVSAGSNSPNYRFMDIYTGEILGVLNTNNPQLEIIDYKGTLYGTTLNRKGNTYTTIF